MKKQTLNMNFIVSAALTLAVILLAGILGDYYFDLNDDVLMKDILAGVYTGTPTGHNIQMLYPISAFVSALYRIYRGLDWYGIFLCFCQYFCVFLIMERALDMNESRLYRIYVATGIFFFMLGAVGAHFLFVQYTFTCGLLSATAVFLVMTHTDGEKRDLVLAAILIITAFLIRSEMLLLTLPIVGVGILIKWAFSRVELKDFYQNGVQISSYGERKKLLTEYVRFCLIVGIGLILSLLINKIAYSSPDWKSFNAFFDARTELYDFQYVPDYEDNKAFYDSIGLTKSQQQLLVNYNFGIDEEIDTDVINAVADYAASQRTDETPLLTRLSQGLSAYMYRLRHVAFQKSYEYPMTDAPFNVITAVLYLGTSVIYLADKDRKKRLLAVFSLLLLFACRSTLWMYIIVRGRDPIRITHPLYIMEIAVLFGMIVSRARNHRRYVFIPLVIATIIAIMFVPNQIMVTGDEMAERAKMRQHYDALYDYFEENSDNFYFVDVYTSVSALEGTEKTFSEKMFDRVDNTASNHDIMGGWASKSPLYYDKLSDNGFESMEKALLMDNAYVVCKKSSDVSWIIEYYRDKGTAVTVDEIDQVTDAFLIYKVRSLD